MRVDELQRDLASARDDQLAADVTAGRHGVDQRVRRHRVQRAGLAVVVVALLAGAGVFVATRGTDEQRVISGPGAIPHYLPDPMPEGVPWLLEFPAGSGASSDASLRVQSIVWTDGSADTPDVGSRTYSLSVRRPEVTPRFELQVVEEDAGVTATWVDSDGYVLTLRGVGINRYAILAAQRSVVVDSEGRASMEVPPGFYAVTHALYVDTPGLQGPTFPFVPSNAPNGGYTVRFVDHSGITIGLFEVARLEQSHAWLMHANWEALTPTEVRGRSGYRQVLTGSSPTDRVEPPVKGFALYWWERDDVVVSAVARTEQEARALAESLREVSEEEWSRFAASVESASPATVTTVP